MAKYAGIVGYVHEAQEVKPGVWKDLIVERTYFGDVVRNVRRLDEVDKVNLDTSIGNAFSIVADAYAIEHFFAIRFIQWAGVFWIATNVEVQHPRLLIRPGGVYNGPRAEAPGSP